MAHDLSDLPSGNILVATGYTLGQLASGVHHEAVAVNASGAVSTLDFAGKSVLQFTVTGNLTGSYTLPPSNVPALTQNATRAYIFVEYTQDATGGWSIPLATLFANAGNATHMGNPSVDLAPGGRTRVKLIIYRAGGVTLCHVEFIPQHVHANLSVATQHSLAGGGDLSTARTLALVGDVASPGNSMFYGTNATTGVREWRTVPAGGGGATTLDGLTDVTIGSPADEQVLTYDSGTSQWIPATVTIPGGSGTVVDNMAALQGIATPVAGEFVFVRGYTAATDGGGGLFQWDASYTDFKMVTGGTVQAGGTGWAVGQMFWVDTGTTAHSRGFSLFKVETISGSAVTGITLVDSGQYSVTPSASASATGTDGATGSGLTVNLTIVSWTNGGTVIPKTAGGTGRWLRRYEGKQNVKWFGATGDGTTDDSTAIQRAVNTYETVVFPNGNYKCMKAITWWTERTLSLEGLGGNYGWNTASIIAGYNTAEPVLHKFGRWMKSDGTYQFETGFEVEGNNLGGVGQFVYLSNLRFVSTVSIYGSCVELTLTDDVHVEFCAFEGGFRGLTCGQAVFDTAIINCRFESPFMNNFAWTGTTSGEANTLVARRAWGLYVNGHSVALNNAFVGCGTGYRATGIENSLLGARIEVNNYGIFLATQEFRMGEIAGSLLTRSTLKGLSLEANTYGILIFDMECCSVSDFSIQGSVELLPRPLSEYGIYADNMRTDCTVERFSANGDFKHYALLNTSPVPFRQYMCNATRNYGATNAPLLLRGGSVSDAHYLASSIPVGARRTYFRGLLHNGLTQLDARTSNVRAKNLGGSVVVAQGAQTAGVTFQSEIGIGTIAFNTITLTADGASTLSAITYYYATTVVGWNGEVGVNYWDAANHNHRSIAVTAGNRVSMTFYGGDTAKHERRVYRGTALGTFDGYWQMAATATFFDNGLTAFTSTGMPPPDGNLPSTTEDDTLYHVVLTSQTANIGATWVTSKTTSGFTVNCATAAPSGGATVSWMLLRA